MPWREVKEHTSRRGRSQETRHRFFHLTVGSSRLQDSHSKEFQFMWVSVFPIIWVLCWHSYRPVLLENFGRGKCSHFLSRGAKFLESAESANRIQSRWTPAKSPILSKISLVSADRKWVTAGLHHQRTPLQCWIQTFKKAKYTISFSSPFQQKLLYTPQRTGSLLKPEF